VIECLVTEEGKERVLEAGEGAHGWHCSS